MSVSGRRSFTLALAALAVVPLAQGASALSNDRIALSVNGGSLTGTNGGAGGSVTWLHNFNADALVGVAAEHQTIGNGHWTFGSLNGSVTLGSGGQRYTLYGEAHEGAGDDGPRPFKYHKEAIGVVGSYARRLSVQLEDTHIDIEKTRGNLPKLGVSYLWTPHLMTTATYSHSIGGNLGTRLGGLRADVYTSTLNYFAGASYGQTSPSIVLIVGGSCVIDCRIPISAVYLKEGYVGISKPFARWASELTLSADYIDLGTTRRFTATLGYLFHIGGSSR
ncbi:MAG TPA: hypothetical protein VJQ47_08750 [Steroidobacteraceae bacterium]|nr:hypothetical protein [Steroidobacteraceae bacterium]